MNLEHSIKEGSHERYPDHFQSFRNIKKIKYPDFQAMTHIKAPQTKISQYKIMEGQEELLSDTTTSTDLELVALDNL